jgi:hypothetical protein
MQCVHALLSQVVGPDFKKCMFLIYPFLLLVPLIIAYLRFVLTNAYCNIKVFKTKNDLLLKEKAYKKVMPIEPTSLSHWNGHVLNIGVCDIPKSNLLFQKVFLK